MYAASLGSYGAIGRYIDNQNTPSMSSKSNAMSDSCLLG